MMRASSLRHRSPLLLLAVALLALAVLLVHDTPPAAQAQQTPTVLVSNIGQATAAVLATTLVQAQAFTTGANPAGYTLASIETAINQAPTSAQRDTIRAQLWPSVASGDDAGKPDEKLYDLTVPAHPITAGAVAFTAPADTTLAANTTYHAVFYTDGAVSMAYNVVTSDNEDSGGAAGWTIANGRRSVDVNEPTSTTTWPNEATTSLKIRVNGTQVPTPTVTLSASPNPVDEGSSVTITATLSAAQAGRVTIPLAHTGGTAEPGDHGFLGSITINAGNTSGTTTVTTVHDPDDQHETFTVSLGTLPSGLAAGSPSSVTVTIRDDEAPVSVWEATLTVADVLPGVLLGCDNDTSGTECSTTSVLTDDDFTHGGVDYHVTGIVLSDSGLTFRFDKAIPPDLQGSLVLHADGTQIRLAHGALSTGNTQLDWYDTGLNWSVGDVLLLSLIEAPIDVAYWSPTFHVGEPGGGNLGLPQRLRRAVQRPRRAHRPRLQLHQEHLRPSRRALHLDLPGGGALPHQ